MIQIPKILNFYFKSDFFFILLILYEISCMRFSNRFDLTRAFSLMEMIKGSQEVPIPQMINWKKGPIFILFSSKLPRKKSLQCSTRLIPENNLRSLIRKGVTCTLTTTLGLTILNLHTWSCNIFWERTE